LLDELRAVRLHPGPEGKGEPLLGAIPYGSRQWRFDRAEKKRFVGPTPELRRVRQSAQAFDEGRIEKWNAGLDRMSHRHHVGVPEELVAEVVRELELDGRVEWVRFAQPMGRKR
jgi:hypothetical protein